MIKALALGSAVVLLGCAEHNVHRYPQTIYKIITAPEVEAKVEAVYTKPIETVNRNPCLDTIIQENSTPVILIDKSRYELIMLENLVDGNWKEHSRYKTALGRVHGAKTKQGDLKTPEGHYRIIKKLATSGEFESDYLKRLNSMSIQGRTRAFGDYALLLDYPNSLDRQLGRTGSGIMIHEAEQVGLDSTSGCIGLLSGDMSEIFRLVSVGTSVVIAPYCR